MVTLKITREIKTFTTQIVKDIVLFKAFVLIVFTVGTISTFIMVDDI